MVEIAPLELLGNPAPNQARVRPLQGGVSICICPNRDDASCTGHFGTGGALVVDSLGTHYLMSAMHVMYAQGADVIQPSKTHGGHNHLKIPLGKGKFKYTAPKDNIGSVVRLAPAGIDAAIAECINAKPDQIGLAAPAPPQAAIVGLPVAKSGARTGVTTGQCVADSVHFSPTAAKKYLKLYSTKYKGWSSKTNMGGLFMVSPDTFGDGGDSGSLVIAWATSAADRSFLSANNVQSNAGIGLLIGYIPTSHGDVIVGQDLTTCLNALNVSLV